MLQYLRECCRNGKYHCILLLPTPKKQNAAQAQVALTSPTSKLYMESMAKAVKKDTDPKEKPKGKPKETDPNAEKPKGGKKKQPPAPQPKKPKGKKAKADDDEEESTASDSVSPANE